MDYFGYREKQATRKLEEQQNQNGYLACNRLVC